MNMTTIAVVAIVCWAIVTIVGEQKNKSKNSNKENLKMRNEYDEKIAQLNERISTLERIVTDEKYSLNRECDSLK